jgi:hypothetical protein
MHNDATKPGFALTPRDARGLDCRAMDRDRAAWLQQRRDAVRAEYDLEATDVEEDWAYWHLLVRTPLSYAPSR